MLMVIYLQILFKIVSYLIQDSSVGIANGYDVDGLGIEYRCRQEFSLPRTRPYLPWGQFCLFSAGAGVIEVG